MKTLVFVACRPVVISYLVLRFALRWVAIFILPVDLVFHLFGYGLAWILFQVWRSTSSVTSDTYEADEPTTADWKTWGRCMTEAGFDTLAGVVLLMLVVTFAFGPDVLAPIANIFGNEDYLAWIPFWLVSLLPFLIRLNRSTAAE